MNGFLTRAGAAATAGVALGALMITAASASGGGTVAIHHGALSPVGIVAGHGGALRLTHKDHAIGQITDTLTSTRTSAGYQAAVRAGSATVSAASFTVPTLTCTTATRAIAADIGVWANRYRTWSIAGVFIGCANGKAAYYPSLVVNTHETDYTSTPLSAGDVINLTTKVSKFRTKVEVTDVTTGVTEKLTGSGASASAAWIGDDGWSTSTGHLFHVPDFGKLTFKNCLINGKAFARWHPHAYQRVNSLGRVQIATGGLWPTGTAFSTHYEHS